MLFVVFLSNTNGFVKKIVLLGRLDLLLAMTYVSVEI